MGIRAATRDYRMSQWAQVVQERIDSGLSVEEFCVSIGISRNSYYYRLRKLRETALERVGQLQESSQGLASPAFTEVKLSGMPAMQFENGRRLQVEIGPCRIIADAGYPAQSLAALLRELVRYD
jgi:putative transposase